MSCRSLGDRYIPGFCPSTGSGQQHPFQDTSSTVCKSKIFYLPLAFMHMIDFFWGDAIPWPHILQLTPEGNPQQTKVVVAPNV